LTPFRERLETPGGFTIAVELVTARGLVTAERSRALVEKARALAADPRIDVLSITDNPGGNAMLAPDTLGTDLVSRGQQVIIHLACKDWNRNALESRGWKLASEGFDNVLCLSGDYPLAGYGGTAAPVFDIDSVGLLKLYSDMNAGLHVARTGERLDHTDFFLGCVVTNHKLHEREVVPQYQKLAKKARTGARFVINQIGYNARKDDELVRYIAHEQLPVKALANVYLLSRPAARAFHAGKIPGVVVTDDLLALAERHAAAEDKGRAFFLDLAAKQLTVARGLGFNGAYLGGHATADTFFEILDRAHAYAEQANWRELSRELRFGRPAEFYLFDQDPDTGLSSDTLNPMYVKSKQKRRTDLRTPLVYRFSRLVHKTVFEPEGPLHDSARALYEKIDAAPKPVGRAAHALEQAAKVPLFKCRDCGDCSLPDIAYVCPESVCAKNQRNGPCGGTRDGICEVYDSECIWSQAYERLKAYGEEEDMLNNPVVVKDNGLARTSAWANDLLGRDHHAKDGEFSG
jgi:methylenetetrahydrofolate reductase (NADPH)